MTTLMADAVLQLFSAIVVVIQPWFDTTPHEWLNMYIPSITCCWRRGMSYCCIWRWNQNFPVKFIQLHQFTSVTHHTSHPVIGACVLCQQKLNLLNIIIRSKIWIQFWYLKTAVSAVERICCFLIFKCKKIEWWEKNINTKQTKQNV